MKRDLFSRVRGDVYVIAPPIVSTDAEIDQIVEIMRNIVVAILGKG